MARLLRKYVLFPLRTGTLATGAMQVTYRSSHGIRSGETRGSNPLQIQVSDVPAQGRPAGFRSGDVGRFTLTGTVAPRQVQAPGSVAVTLTVEGVGNLPVSLPTQSSKTVQWLDPEISEQIEIVGGKFGGARTFNYVVKLPTAGDIDLGDVSFVYYDPEQKRYGTATASLGVVKVLPSDGKAPGQDDPEPTDRFASVAGIRGSLGTYEPAGTPMTDRGWYWLALLAGPVGVVAVQLGMRGSKRVQRSLDTWRGSSARRIRSILREAAQKGQSGDAAAAAASVEKAVHEIVEAATGIKSRAVLRNDLEARLVEASVARDVAEQVVSLLEDCEAWRYHPDASEHRVEELIESCRRLASRLGKKGS